MNPFLAQHIANLDPKDLVTAVRGIVKESDPEAKYVKWVSVEGAQGGDPIGCQYTPTTHNTRGCLIGAAFREVGILPDSLDHLGISNVGTVFRKADQAVGVPAREDDAIRWLAIVQEQQDNGTTWADAVLTADNNYPSIAESK